MCAERNGKHFEKDKVPLDHPLGRCTLLTDVGDLEDIARELRSWVDGKPNEKLDNWFKEYEVDEPNKTVNKEPKLEIIREEDAKTYKKYTEKEINNFAQNNEKILNKHISKQSKWSGKIIVNDRKRIYGKLWSCDICVYPELSPMIIMHEQIHARSVSYYDKRIYEEFQKIEEATVQFATQEICGKEGIEILESGYDELIDILRELNEMANLYDNNYDFAIDLINLDLPNRLNWLETTMYNIFIKKGNLNDMVKFNELISELYGGIE